MPLELKRQKNRIIKMKKNKKVISVNDLTKNDFEEIMEKASKKKKVPMIKSEQVNMRLTPDILKIAKELAKRSSKPMTTFLSELLVEDLKRIWKLVN
jgi:aspartate carbamoyltransferase catalytic subunit